MSNADTIKRLKNAENYCSFWNRFVWGVQHTIEVVKYILGKKNLEPILGEYKRNSAYLSSKEFLEGSRENYEGNMGKLAVNVDVLINPKKTRKKKRRAKTKKRNNI